MKKKQMVCLIAFMLLALIVPGVNAKEISTEKAICKYEYQDGLTKELTYKVYADEVVVPFEDGENNWYHGQDFAKTYLEQAKTNSINYVCPTITIEESDLFTTVFNNPRNEEDCNGKCTTLVAKTALSQENITVKKAVDTTAIGSVGVYKDDKYFIPYFRLLEDGTKEWSVNGKMFISTDSAAVVKTSSTETTIIKLDEKLVNEIYENNKLNSNVKIYRNVKKLSANQYEYLLSTTKDVSYNLTDGQETKASAYKAAYGDVTEEDMEDWMEGYNEQQDCSETGLLGNVNDPNSVAWLLQKVLNYIRVLGPFIVVIMSSIDFAKVIIMGDDEGRKKAQTKLIIRLLLAASLFFLPMLVSAILDLFGLTSNTTCGIQ